MYCPRKNSSGFTIIELLVTVVIIGVLATIVTLSYVNLSSRATSAALQSDLRSAATQLEIDKTQNGDYPATDVDANGGKGLPKSSGTSYQYTYSNGQYYLSATSGMMAFYTSSLLGTITSGVWSGHIPPGGGVIWSQISINQQHSCGVASDGKAYCWGVNNQGQLGNGTKTDSMTLAPVDMTGALNGLTVSNIAVGSNHTCAIASDSYVYCWGSTTGDAVGIDWTIYGYWKTTPTAITTSGALGTKTVKSLKTGFNHNCVIASDNNVYCWGGNSNGQLGNNSTSSSYAPVAIDTSGALSGKTIKSLSAGGYTTCVIASDDKPYCWGYNNYGQLGNNSTSQSTVPVAVDMTGVLNGKTVKAISVNYYHTCVIASDDRAYCWGSNVYGGELGNNSSSASYVPVAVDTSGVLSGKTIKAIASGDYHTCAIASDDNEYCWGGNNYGNLGTNSWPSYSLTPVAVYTGGAFNGKTIKSIYAGSFMSCAIASDNKAYCWGYDSNGQLGDNSTSAKNAPVVVQTPPQS